jgi:hypothetical protein
MESGFFVQMFKLMQQNFQVEQQKWINSSFDYFHFNACGTQAGAKNW